jgi:hypothetical protein
VRRRPLAVRPPHALFICFRPSSDHALFKLNRPSVAPVEKLVNRSLLGQITCASTEPETNGEEIDWSMPFRRTGLLIAAAYGGFFSAGVVQGDGGHDWAVSTFMLWTIVLTCDSM